MLVLPLDIFKERAMKLSWSFIPLLTFVAGLAALVGLLVCATPASAFTASNPIGQTASWSDVWTALEGAASTVPSEVDHSGLAPSQATKDIIYKAASGAELMPELGPDAAVGLCTSGVAAAVGCSAGALYVGWEIGTGARHLFQWMWGAADGGNKTGGMYTVHFDQWYPSTASTTGLVSQVAPVCAGVPCFYAEVSGSGVPDSATYGWSCGHCASYNAVKAALQAQTAGHLIEASDAPCGGTGNACMFRYATVAEMAAAMHVGNISPWTSSELPYVQSHFPSFSPASDPGATSSSADQARADLLAGDDDQDNEVAQTLLPDWEGEAFEWPAAETTETYSQYVTRLRSLGWLGTATVSALGAIAADPAYALSGVPCTSVPAGTTIGTLDPVTFYQNPSASFFDEHASDGGSCGRGSTTTSAGGPPDCEFNDAVTKQHKSWRDALEDDPVVLNMECAEAIAILQAAGYLDESGGLTEAAKTDAVDMVGLVIKNPVLIELLPTLGDDIDYWFKVFINNKDEEPFQTEEGSSFELHFYRDISGTVYTGDDFKIVFKDWIL
jgi:hypothetical protein